MGVKVSSKALRTSDKEDNYSMNKDKEFSKRSKFNGKNMMSVF